MATDPTQNSTGRKPSRQGEPIRIILVEDHAILREGLRALLEIETDLEIVGEAGDARSAMEAVQEFRPAVLITDLALPNGSGISLIRALLEVESGIRALVLTGYRDEEYIRAAMDAGAMGYVLKDSSREELIRAIRSVSEGRQYLCSAVAQTVMSGYLRPDAAKPSADPMERVTNREREVLIKIAGGLSSKMIARELGLSVKTIEKHRANLMRKLELRNAAEVTMFAVRHGLLPRDPDAGLGGTFEP